ncbi:MAG: signal peptide peptidase SppA [Bacteroidota bacterium]|nr:signal peptide peptidase SppA [Bacteroidota bacterium]
MSNSGKWILGIGAALFGIGFIILAFAFLTFSTSVTSLSTDEQEESTASGKDRVAIVEIDDAITGSDEVIKEIRTYRKKTSVKAIVIRLNSPGGAVAPSQEIYEEVRKTVSMGIPVVASMGSVAASGAYYIACGAQRIVANPGSITGSIGVVSEFVNIKRLLDKIGIEQTTIKSGKFKDIGNPARGFTPEEIEQMQTLIDDVYEQFIEAVSYGRSLPIDSVRRIADGRIYTGRQALRLGLVDTLGTLQTAVAIAGKLGKITGEPRVIRKRREASLFERILGTETVEFVRDVQSRVRPPSPFEYRMQFPTSHEVTP